MYADAPVAVLVCTHAEQISRAGERAGSSWDGREYILLGPLTLQYFERLWDTQGSSSYLVHGICFTLDRISGMQKIETMLRRLEVKSRSNVDVSKRTGLQ